MNVAVKRMPAPRLYGEAHSAPPWPRLAVRRCRTKLEDWKMQANTVNACAPSMGVVMRVTLYVLYVPQQGRPSDGPFRVTYFVTHFAMSRSPEQVNHAK